MDPGSHEFWETCIDIVPGTLNPADMLTKCLASAEHRRYREVLGYQIRELNPVVSVIEFLGNESGVLMSITGEIRSCLLCGDPLGPVGRASEGSSLDTSSVLASLLAVMSSSSESDGTRRRQLHAASLPAEGRVIGEVPGEFQPLCRREASGPVLWQRLRVRRRRHLCRRRAHKGKRCGGSAGSAGS